MSAFTKDSNDPHRYDDMLQMTHHVSGNHPHMSALQRAAQFMPFAALNGYDEALEKVRKRMEKEDKASSLSEEEMQTLLQKILDGKENTKVHISYLDAQGNQQECDGVIKRIEAENRRLILEDSSVILLEQVEKIAPL